MLGRSTIKSDIIHRKVMKSGKCILLLRRLRMGKIKYQRQEGIAYHEAAHSVVANLRGHTTNFIEIKYNPRKGILPNHDRNHEADEDVLDEIIEIDNIALHNRTRKEVLDAAENHCIILLAGTIAKFKFLFNNRRKPSREEINISDKEKIDHCLAVLSAFYGRTFDEDIFYNDC